MWSSLIRFIFSGVLCKEKHIKTVTTENVHCFLHHHPPPPPTVWMSFHPFEGGTYWKLNVTMNSQDTALMSAVRRLQRWTKEPRWRICVLLRFTRKKNILLASHTRAHTNTPSLSPHWSPSYTLSLTLSPYLIPFTHAQPHKHTHTHTVVWVAVPQSALHEVYSDQRIHFVSLSRSSRQKQTGWK